MSNKSTEFTEKQVADMTKLIKIISESVRSYLENLDDPSVAPGNDTSLYAMQVLSLMCGMSRGYSRDQLDGMWEMSAKLSQKLHAARKNDKATSPFQGAAAAEVAYKN